jgi:hypothetical protein
MARPMALTPLGRTMQLPLTLAGGVADDIRRGCFLPADESVGGAHGSIGGRSHRTLRESANGAIPTETWNRINRRGGR